MTRRYTIDAAAFLLIVCTIGLAHATITFFTDTPTSITELVFPLAGLFVVLLLCRESRFFSAALLAISAFPLAASTIIVNDYWGTVSFSTEFPEQVFTEPTKSSALHAFLGSFCLLAIVLLTHRSKPWVWSAPQRDEIHFARKHWGLFLIMYLGIAFLNIKGPLITAVGYHADDWNGGFNAGFDGLWSMLAVAAVCAALRGYGHRHINFQVAVFALLASLLFFRLLRGERSTAFAILIFLSILYYKLARSRWKLAWISIFLTAGLVFLLVWASVRASAVEDGLLASVSTGTSNSISDITSGSLMNMDRAPKLTWDLLETAYLYDAGVRRNGSTYANLLPQFVPSFLADAVGYERPLAEPWILASYFRHGGGIFMFAEAYWNFGLIGCLGLGLILGLLSRVVETTFRRLPVVFVFAYFGLILITVQTLYVGVQSFVRGLEMGLAVTWMGLSLMRRGVAQHK